MRINGFQTIIFDLGNVIVDIDSELAFQSFEKLLRKKIQRNEAINLLDEFEAGRVSIDEFYDFFKTQSARKISNEEIDQAWNSMIIKIPSSRLSLLLALKEKYQLFALSNTNEIHIKWINTYLQDNYQVVSLREYFSKSYYSHEMGFRKPEIDIYLPVIKALGHPKEKALFIDDRLENIEAASKIGLPSIQHNPKEDVELLLKRFDLL